MEDKKYIKINSEFSSYWSVFLTLNCNYNCEYCIQKIYGKLPNFDSIRGKDWIYTLNSIVNRTKSRFLRGPRMKKLAIIGGEPTLHPDFIEIINGLDNHWHITVTTNLGTPIFKDIDSFLKKLKRRHGLRFNASLHPINNINIDDFINKIKMLKKDRVNVNRIFIVAYPPDSLTIIKEFKEKFAKEKMLLEVQRFTGFYNGRLYPSGENRMEEYEFDDNINDYKLYNEACGLNKREKILCKISKVLFAPNGNIYNCHYKLYTDSNDNYGNLFDNKRFAFDLPLDYFLCDSYGFCNPCDFGLVSFKK